MKAVNSQKKQVNLQTSSPGMKNSGLTLHESPLMTCLRCDGLLVKEFCMDIHDGTGENGFWALRCLQCGEILDPLILQHRLTPSPPVLSGRSRQRAPVALS